MAGNVVIEVALWSEFVNIVVTTKKVKLQYKEDAVFYDIYASDSVIWHIRLKKGDADATDFENNYKAGANTRHVIASQIVDSTGNNSADVFDDGSNYRLRVEAKVAPGGAPQDVNLVDPDGDDLTVSEGEDLVANDKDFGIPIAGRDLADIGRLVTVTNDSEDGKNRLEVSGKISVSVPPPPPSATAKQVAADTPLNVSGTINTDYKITNGTTFTVQSFAAGAEGDPTEKGAKVEVLYVDASSVEHVISRIYIVGQTVQVFPDVSAARDGTALVGTVAAGTGLIRIRREQFGGGTRELEGVVRGFEL